jgi:hypothetical protein
MAKRPPETFEGPHWHYDCRIVAELPENRLVGIRFLTTTAFALTASVSFLMAMFLLYRDFTLSYQINDWFQRIEDAREGMKDIDQMRAEYDADANRIDAAYEVMKHPYVVSDFLARLGKILPEDMEIDDIQSSDAGIVIRGTMRVSTAAASKTLGGFVKTLNSNGPISSLFSPIRLTKLSRRDADDVITYSITFQNRT